MKRKRKSTPTVVSSTELKDYWDMDYDEQMAFVEQLLGGFASSFGDRHIRGVSVYYCDEYVCDAYSIDTRRKARDIVASLNQHPIPGVVVRRPEPATYQQLVRVHQRRYVDGILTGAPKTAAANNGIGTWTPELAQSVIFSTGGVIAAAREAVQTGNNTGSLSSGLHHAKHSQGEGFCTINGIVVAARVVLDEGARRVLIIDFDAHCGGGTAHLIEGVQGIEQIDVSVNSFDWYESTPQSRLSLASGLTYLVAVESALDSVENPEEIDLVIYNAGMDPYEKCPVGGRRRITTEVLRRREEIVFAWAKEAGIPVAFVLAGGYTGHDFTTDELVDLHRLTIEVAAGVY